MNPSMGSSHVEDWSTCLNEVKRVSRAYAMTNPMSTDRHISLFPKVRIRYGIIRIWRRKLDILLPQQVSLTHMHHILQSLAS